MARIKQKSKVFICALLIFTLLTFQIGHVKRAEAFAITGTVVAASLLATGAIYLGYLTLTGAEVKLPRENVADYVTSIGDKITQYGTGAGIYATVYNYLFNNGVEALGDLNVDLDSETLLDFYNTSKDIAAIQAQLSFYQAANPDAPTTNFDYPFTISPMPSTVNVYGDIKSFDYVINTYSFPYFPYAHRVIENDANHTMFYAYYSYNNSADYEMRNIKYTNGHYGVQTLINGTWTDTNYLRDAFYSPSSDLTLYMSNGLLYLDRSSHSDTYFYRTYPPLTDAVIYIQSTGEIIETVQNEDGVYVPSPEWPNNHDDDNNKYPIVPYVELPTSQPGNYVPSKWGVNMGDLLDTLENLADDLVTVGTLGNLINDFKNSLNGTDTYNEYEYYNDNDYTYNYYYNNVIQNDNNYNINQNIEKDEYNMPVDMNNIRLVTDNEYINALQSDITNFTDTGADILALWHNSDYLTLYIVMGSAIFVLVCALIGKMGK